MLTLSLLRHAKSSWSDSSLKDIERPLNGRGERDAPRMGDFMIEQGLAPDLILCSPAVRTRRTLDLVLPRLMAAASKPSPEMRSETVPEVVYLDALYPGAPAAMLGELRRILPSMRRVLLIGHNPGLQELALDLAGEGAKRDLQALAAKLPTAGLAVLEFDVVSWPKVHPGGGRLRLLTAPKRLE